MFEMAVWITKKHKVLLFAYFFYHTPLVNGSAGRKKLAEKWHDQYFFKSDT